MRAFTTLRSRALAGSVAIGTLGLALASPAQALQKIESVTITAKGQTSSQTDFPLFNPFDPVLGKSLVLRAVSVSLSGTAGGSVVYRHTGTTSGTISSPITYLPNLQNWFNLGVGNSDVPDQIPSTAATNLTTTTSLPISSTSTQSVTVNFSNTSIGTYNFDMTPYLSYFIGSGTGSTQLFNDVEAAVSGSGFNSTPFNSGGFTFSGTSNLVVTYDYYVYEAPGPLPVAGGVAAFGWSRRLRRRLRGGRLPQA